LEAKMRTVLGTDQRRVRRAAIQWLYHNFRCRSWDGKVDSVSSRFGFTAMPYLERSVTEHGCALPLRWRNHGAYEAAIIRKVDARLAANPTNYGHDSSAPPPLSRRLHDYLTYLRLPLLRRYTFRIKNRRNQARARSGYLALDYQKAMLPDGVSLTAPLFRL